MIKSRSKSYFGGKNNIVMTTKFIDSLIQNIKNDLDKIELDMEQRIITENITNDLILSGKASYFLSSDYINEDSTIQPITDKKMIDIETKIPQGKNKSFLQTLYSKRPSLRNVLLGAVLLGTMALGIHYMLRSEDNPSVEPYVSPQCAIMEYQAKTPPYTQSLSSFNQHCLTTYKPDLHSLPIGLQSGPIPIETSTTNFVCSVDPLSNPNQCSIEQQFFEKAADTSIIPGIQNDSGMIETYNEPINLRARPIPIETPQSNFVCSVDPLLNPQQCSIELQFFEKAADPSIIPGIQVPNDRGRTETYDELCIDGNCAGNISIPRDNMPQVSKDDIPTLKEQHVEVQEYELDKKGFIEALNHPTHPLVPSQETANANAVHKIHQKFSKSVGKSKPIFISNDGFIIDGHHRFHAYNEALKTDSWPIDGKIKVVEIDLPILEALQRLRGFGHNVEDMFFTTYRVTPGGKNRKNRSRKKKYNRKYKISKKKSIKILN
jgi:hypothetical protein